MKSNELRVRTVDEQKVVEYASETLRIPKERAEQLLFEPQATEQYLRYHKARSDLQAVELLKQLETVISENVTRSRIHAVQPLVVSWAVIRDKLYGRESSKQAFPTIGAENMQINVSWKPQWMRGGKKKLLGGKRVLTSDER